ncbi:hypothetical protein L3Q82_007095 [Scortum barcoo]|uniref:Uncharacterized protein n=1 Tax=Scortum barcoo TaxID=214431 RepID=A0ACB8WSV5_9TELE|nr:hypothetical protein L3Q82_007095 [Scortum barcoo]
MTIHIPDNYHDLKLVCSKSKATSLPPDCPIDLIARSAIPKSRLYSLREYIEMSLKAGLICPSSSPTRAGFFFVAKKDGSLRPCIDYSSLNNITIKNRIREGDEQTGFNPPTGHYEYLPRPSTKRLRETAGIITATNNSFTVQLPVLVSYINPVLP